MDNFFVPSGSAWRRQDTRVPPRLKARVNVSAALPVIRARHFVGGDPQSAGFCDGPGPGMALEQNPFLPPTRPGGANGKRFLNDPTEQLNITSRCITRSL